MAFKGSSSSTRRCLQAGLKAFAALGFWQLSTNASEPLAISRHRECLRIPMHGSSAVVRAVSFELRPPATPGGSHCAFDLSLPELKFAIGDDPHALKIRNHPISMTEETSSERAPSQSEDSALPAPNAATEVRRNP